MEKKEFFLLLTCASTNGAFKELLGVIEGDAIIPDGQIMLHHKLSKDLHMVDEDVLSTLARIESKLGDSSRTVFGNDESWKSLRTVGDVINKVVTYVRQQIDTKKNDLWRYLVSDDGALKAIEIVAKRENLIPDECEIVPNDDLKKLELDSLDALHIMAELDDVFVSLPNVSMFRKDWNSLKNISDLVHDMKEYASQELAA